MSESARQEIRFEGVGVSPGMACSKIHVVRDDLDDVVRYRIAPSQIPDEIGRFETALIQTRMQILEMQQRIAESIGAKDAAIFDAHLLVVEDRTLIDEVLRKLETDLCNVEWVFQEVRYLPRAQCDGHHAWSILSYAVLSVVPRPWLSWIQSLHSAQPFLAPGR